MSDSFSVDINALGQIPTMVQTARSMLVDSEVESIAIAAAKAVSPGFGNGITSFGIAVEVFARAGSSALTDDMSKLTATAANYERTEQGVVKSEYGLMGSVGSQW
jgi:hypothetical protein